MVTPEPAGEAVADSDTRKRGGGGGGRSLGGSDTTGGQCDRARVSDRAVCSGVSIGQAPRVVGRKSFRIVFC